MLNRFHVAWFATLFFRSQRIKHGSSTASSERTGVHSMYCTMPNNEPTSRHRFPSRQRIIEKITMITFKVRVHGQSLTLPISSSTTHHLEQCVLVERIYSSSSVQDAFRHQNIPCRSSSDVERPAKSHLVYHYHKQLPETTKNISIWYFI